MTLPTHHSAALRALLAQPGAARFDAAARGGSALFAAVFGQARPALCLAPLHDASDHALRVLSRARGADFAATPMMHAAQLAGSRRLARQWLDAATSRADRPLVVQLAAAEPADAEAAAAAVAHVADAVELNLGCPQRVARRGRYGAFQLEDLPRATACVRALRRGAPERPAFVKVRALATREATIDACRALRDAGASVITVHGRTRHQVRDNCGDADEQLMAAVAAALDVPVVCNGNARTRADALRIARSTGCAGAMVGWPVLHLDLVLFDDVHRSRVEQLQLYLRYARQFPDRFVMVRGHVFDCVRDTLLAHNRPLLGQLARVMRGKARETVDWNELDRLVAQVRALEQKHDADASADVAADDAAAIEQLDKRQKVST